MSNLFIQSVKKRLRGQRGGRWVRERKRQRLQVAVYKPMCRVPAPELIDLTLFDSDDETVIVPPVPSAFEILDTS